MVLKGIILATFCSFISLLAHLALSLFRKGRDKNEPLILELIRQAKLLISIWALFFILYFILYFSPLPELDTLINRLSSSLTLISFINGIIFYLFLAFIYLSFYYLIDRSVSATILEIIECSPKERLTAEEIKKIYNLEKKYALELKGMLEGGFIVRESEYYRNTFKGRIVARIVKLMKTYLKLGPGG